MTRAEELLKAKIPGAETGIEVRRSLCDICTPGVHCGLNAYVKDGEVIKIEGLDGYPGSNGKLCTKGASNRQYLYRKDRLKTPMRRVGARGEGRFEAISWEEAYAEIAQRLNRIKAEEGPEAVAWFTGYSKWYRPWLHRLTHSFGSLNYGTESSSCFQANKMAWETITGRMFRPDMPSAEVFVGWGCNTLVNFYTQGKALAALKKRGGKVIIVDPRLTPTAQKLADIHLQLRPGTDGALALGMGRLILERGWEDREYIEKYVHGFEEYKKLVEPWTLERTEEVTGVPKEKIAAATTLYATGGRAATYMPSAAMTHHINGFNSSRAVMALQAILGNVDRRGGSLPSHFSFVYTDCGFPSIDEDFMHETKPANCRERIGARRFPLWNHFVDEFQAMDLTRAIEEADPYPIKALMAFGANARMFPEPERLLSALDKLDLVVATDIFFTDFCRHADILLPACTSLERSELKGYAGGFLTCTAPVIPPLYESKPDTVIICELARALKLDDELLCGGYEHTMCHMIRDLGVTLEELRAAPLPVKLASARPYRPGTYLEQGFPTPSGKLELYSEVIAALRDQAPELDPLPSYSDGFGGAEDQRYPYTFVAGARLPNAIHSRLHDVPWARSLRQSPAADLHPDTAAEIGAEEGDDVEIFTPTGKITVKAHLTYTVLPGDVYLFHGYREASANDLIGSRHLDPYSGFPGYRQSRCGVRKAGG